MPIKRESALLKPKAASSWSKKNTLLLWFNVNKIKMSWQETLCELHARIASAW